MSQSVPHSDCWTQREFTTDRAAWAINERQAAKDWLQNLRLRAVELMPGGFLVATALSWKHSEGVTTLFAEWGHQCWQEVLKQGLITQQEFADFTFGSYLRSREEWLSPLQGEMAGAFEVLNFQVTPAVL